MPNDNTISIHEGNISIEQIRNAQRILNEGVLNVPLISDFTRETYERYRRSFEPGTIRHFQRYQSITVASPDPKIIECEKCGCVSIIGPGDDPDQCPVCPNKKREKEERKRHKKDEKGKEKTKLQRLSAQQLQGGELQEGHRFIRIASDGDL